MSSFLQNLVNRHIKTSDTVMPRLSGVFEAGSPWATTDNTVEDQNEMINPADHKSSIEHSYVGDPIKGYNDLLKGNLNIQQHSDLSEEELQNKRPSSSVITSKEKINRIENIEKVITQQQIKVEHTNIDRKEDKAQDKPEVNNEIGKVLARLEALEVLQNKPKTDLLKPGIGFTIPGIQKESVRPSIEKLTTKDSSQPSPPVIKIHIGKIEIKAEKQESTRVVKSPPPKPELSLEQYLQDRKSKS